LLTDKLPTYAALTVFFPSEDPSYGKGINGV